MNHICLRKAGKEAQTRQYLNPIKGYSPFYEAYKAILRVIKQGIENPKEGQASVIPTFHRSQYRRHDSERLVNLVSSQALIYGKSGVSFEVWLSCKKPG